MVVQAVRPAPNQNFTEGLRRMFHGKQVQPTPQLRENWPGMFVQSAYYRVHTILATFTGSASVVRLHAYLREVVYVGRVGQLFSSLNIVVQNHAATAFQPSNDLVGYVFASHEFCCLQIKAR
jgi:hypothetical protein